MGTEGNSVVLNRLASGHQRFTDVMLKRFIEDSKRTFENVETAESVTILFEDGLELADTEPHTSGSAFEPWKCMICLEETSDVPPDRFCVRPDCAGRFCKDCLRTYCRGTVEGSKFMTLPVRCPAEQCRCRLPMKLWSRFVSTEDIEEYTTGAQNILTIRCASCDVPRTLLVPPAQEKYMFNTGVLKSKLSPEHFQHLKDIGARFVIGVEKADAVLDTLLTGLNTSLADLDLFPGDEDDDNPLTLLLSLISDVERRTVLQLAALRRNPLMRTPCCGEDMCWKCKIDGHHLGMTCEEYQNETLEIGVQPCPGCGVQTERTEGCSSMTCLCGQEWYWHSEEED